MMAVWIFFIPIGFLPLLFLDAARKATSKYVRNGCILTVMGIILFTTAVIIDLPEAAFSMSYYSLSYSQFVVRLISPVLLLIGVIIATIGLKTHFYELESAQ